MDFHEVIRRLIRGEQNTDAHRAEMLAAVDEHEAACKPEPEAAPDEAALAGAAG